MAKRIAPELSALTVERSRLGEQFQDAVRGRPVTAEMHAIVGLNDSLVDLHSRLDSVREVHQGLGHLGWRSIHPQALP